MSRRHGTLRSHMAASLKVRLASNKTGGVLPLVSLTEGCAIDTSLLETRRPARRNPATSKTFNCFQTRVIGQRHVLDGCQNDHLCRLADHAPY
jgi:hypothetical protein